MYIQEMESYLRKQQEEVLLTRTQMVASVMQGRPDLFNTQTVAPLPTQRVYHIFVRPLRGRIQLDGYLDDWMPYEERMQLFTTNNAIKGSETSSLSFHHQLGTYKNYLYVVFQIEDDKIVYRQPNSLYLDKSDHLIIALQDPKGDLKKYIVTTLAPGWVNAHQISNNIYNPKPVQPETRIKGEWQETATGYNIELRIPLDYIGNRISFGIADVDNSENREIDTIIATAGLEDNESLGTLMFPSQEAEALLERLQRPLMRTWVIDQNNRVIARTGSLIQQDSDYKNNDEKPKYSLLTGFMSLIYKLVLKQPTTEFHDELLNASRLNTEEFRHALQGDPDTRWRQTPDKEVNILTATYPVLNNGKVIGAIAIEQTSNSILLIQNRAMEIMFNLSALAFLIACFVLLVFATRLTQRVRRLRDATSEAITTDGRVVGRIEATRDRDEIGDLSRGVADMLDRLSQYNRYLEGMASKLSHELRTPITVVRSSLDNLNESSDPAEIKTYSERARQGIERLNNILTRMSEATRLEQTLQSEQRTNFDIRKIITGCVEGYRVAHPDMTFNLLYKDDADYKINGAPDLVAQLLDKLVSNAIDFVEPDNPVDISLQQNNNTVTLIVANTGPTLPAEMQANLFESMVSVRDKKAEQPHLGLGLYIVRLITDFHHGRVYAINKLDNSGVEFHVEFPSADS